MPVRLNLTFWFRFILLLLPWVFIGYLFRDVDAVRDAFEDATLAPMAGGLILTVAGLFGIALLWIRLVGHLNREVAVPDTPHLLRSFARSWLARYLPGKIWAYSARVIHTDSEVTPKRIVASSLVGEFSMVMASATVLGLGLWAWASAGALVGVPVLVAGTAAAVVAISRLGQLVALTLRYLARAIPERWRTAAEEMRRVEDDPGLGLKASALFMGGYVLVNFVLSLGFVLIVLSVHDIGANDFLLLVGGYNLAGVLGIVAFFAPAGLGVKEGVLVGFLTPVVGAPVAASLAILTRLLSVLADVMLWSGIEGAALVSRSLSHRGRAGPEEQIGVPGSDRRA